MRLGISMGSVCLLLLGWAVAARPAAAQESATGHLLVQCDTADEALRRRPVMVSIIQDGKLVKQYEGKLNFSHRFDDLAVGPYDLRGEGDGLTTLIKRGIVVTSKETTTAQCPMAAGQGAHIVEYATAGLSREETATLLKALTQTVDESKKENAALKSQVESLAGQVASMKTQVEAATEALSAVKSQLTELAAKISQMQK
jgi:hypothetical protein